MKKLWVEGYNNPSKRNHTANQSPQHPNNYNIWTYWDIMSLDIMELIIRAYFGLLQLKNGGRGVGERGGRKGISVPSERAKTCYRANCEAVFINRV